MPLSPIPASCINRGRRMGTTSDVLKMAGELAVVSQWGYNRGHFIVDEDYCNHQHGCDGVALAGCRYRGEPMKYTVIAVGKLKERFWKDACAEYLKRLGGYAKVEVREVADIDPARAGGVDASRNREGASILSSIPDRAHVILLAIEGKEHSSEELSQRLDQLALGGNSDIVFIIGGSDGVSDAVRARANEMLSFGRITMPHNLARVVLLEQVYRAIKISRGEPYHK